MAPFGVPTSVGLDRDIEALRAEISRLHSRVGLLEERLARGWDLVAAFERKLSIVKGRLDKLLRLIVDSLTTLGLEFRMHL